MVSEKKKMLGESELSALPMNADGKRFFHFFDRGPPIILGTLQKGLTLRYSQLTTQSHTVFGLCCQVRTCRFAMFTNTPRFS